MINASLGWRVSELEYHGKPGRVRRPSPPKFSNLYLISPWLKLSLKLISDPVRVGNIFTGTLKGDLLRHYAVISAVPQFRSSVENLMEGSGRWRHSM